MKQRWGLKKRFEEVKTRVLTGGRMLRERLVVIQSGLRSPRCLSHSHTRDCGGS